MATPTDSVVSSYAALLTTVQSTLSTGITKYNYKSGAFNSICPSTSPILILQILVSSLSVTEAEKKTFRPLLNTLILLSQSNLEIMIRDTYTNITKHLHVDGSVAAHGGHHHDLRDIQAIFENDAKKQGLFDTRTTIQATDPETGEVMWTHSVDKKVNIKVVPSGHAEDTKGKMKQIGLGLDALATFDAEKALRTKGMGTVTPGGTIGKEGRKLV